jgi:hypothetical protein
LRCEQKKSTINQECSIFSAAALCPHQGKGRMIARPSIIACSARLICMIMASLFALQRDANQCIMLCLAQRIILLLSFAVNSPKNFQFVFISQIT